MQFQALSHFVTLKSTLYTSVTSYPFDAFQVHHGVQWYSGDGDDVVHVGYSFKCCLVVVDDLLSQPFRDVGQVFGPTSN